MKPLPDGSCGGAEPVRAHFHRAWRRFDAFYGRRRFWQRLTDALFRRSMRLRFDRTLEAVAPGETALDVGCGAGRYGLALARKGAASVLGVDFAASMIEAAAALARERGLEGVCRFQQADFAALEPGGTFDHVFAMGVLDYVAEPVPFVARMVRLARRRVMVSFPSRGGLVQWCRRLIFVYLKRCPVHFFSEAEVRRIARAAGGRAFTVERLAKDFFLTIRLEAASGGTEPRP